VLRIVWELRAGPLNFRELQAACGNLSTSVLNVRLNELRSALLVVHQPDNGYLLSEHGHSLMKAARPLMQWSAHWAWSTGLAQRQEVAPTR
jgi:DNA-binding HxlR family transcriptional regulator